MSPFCYSISSSKLDKVPPSKFGTRLALTERMNDTTYAQAYTAGMDRTIRFIISRGANRELAEETAQMAWTRAWERLHQLKDESTILAWVNTIALNLYRRSFRRHLSFVPLEDMPVTGRLNVVANGRNESEEAGFVTDRNGVGG